MFTPEAVLFVVFAFAIGGVVGSFMNVVVYRLPKRLSLIEPPSHCPHCKHPIRWHDNVPIFGWLLLRGKCRDCGQAISPRYPLVEATVALMFGSLMILEFALQGVNLPRREPIGTLSVASDADWYLIVLYHLTLLCVLFCGALIEFDGNRPPAKMYMGAMLIGLMFPLQWAMLRPMKAWPDEPRLLAGGIDGLFGLAAGGMLGYAAWRIQGTKQAGGLPWGLACAGVFLGWQAALPVGILAAIVGVAIAAVFPRKRSARHIPTSVWLWLLAFLWILSWSPLVRWFELP
ncbi:MAG: prepilin peptidase [Pirellulales bacterium]|nr:prepilin peptidase [Pirellulales bacterium]